MREDPGHSQMFFGFAAVVLDGCACSYREKLEAIIWKPFSDNHKKIGGMYPSAALSSVFPEFNALD